MFSYNQCLQGLTVQLGQATLRLQMMNTVLVQESMDEDVIARCANDVVNQIQSLNDRLQVLVAHKNLGQCELAPAS